MNSKWVQTIETMLWPTLILKKKTEHVGSLGWVVYDEDA